jgi:hypothetical protein
LQNKIRAQKLELQDLIGTEKDSKAKTKENNQATKEAEQSANRLTGALERLKMKMSDLSEEEQFIEILKNIGVINEEVDKLQKNAGKQAEAALSPEVLERALGENEVTIEKLSKQYGAYFAELKKLREEDALSEKEYNTAMTNLKREMWAKKAKIANEKSREMNDIARSSTDLVTSLIELEKNKYKDSADATEEEREKNAEKRKQVEKKYANFKFAADIAEIATNTAVGITKVIASPGFPAAAALIPLIAATGAVQAAIAKQNRDQVMSLGTGGYGDKYGVVTGDSHKDKSGGENFNDHIKVERDEGWSVWNKRVNNKERDKLKNMTNYINEHGHDEYLRNYGMVKYNQTSVININSVVKEQKKTNELLQTQKRYYIDNKGREVEYDVFGNKKRN